jgi:hypothetical protein
MKNTKVVDIDNGIFIFNCFSKVININNEKDIVIRGIDVKKIQVQRVIKAKLDFVRVFKFKYNFFFIIYYLIFSQTLILLRFFILLNLR